MPRAYPPSNSHSQTGNPGMYAHTYVSLNKKLYKFMHEQTPALYLGVYTWLVLPYDLIIASTKKQTKKMP